MSPSVEPFNEAKYRALMDGLEGIEIKYSDLKNFKTMRIDNEYFLKDYIKNENLLDDFGYKTLAEIVETITDFGAYSQTNFIQLQEQGVNFFRNQDVRNNSIDDIGCAKISDGAYEKLTLKLQFNDILIPRTGTLGNASVVLEKHLPASANQNLAVLRDIKEMLPHYVSVVLCSKIGLLQINRNSTGNVQQWLNLDAIKSIKIPNATEEFQKNIQKVVLSSDYYLDASKKMYKNAENMLLDCIGSSFLDLACENNFIKSFNDSFKLSSRLDAEYYQPKYDMIENQLNSNNTVGLTCKIYDNNYIPIDDSIYQYIELSNVDTFGGISTPNRIVGKELPTRARRIVKDGQVIISSIEGSLKSCALITKELDNSLCSTGFYVIDSNTYNSETLLILFKSEPIQMMMKKRCSGTILTAISKEELLKMPLPYIDNEVQKEIAAKVQESFKLRQESKRMLECAVKAVEMAIESDENAAIRWLEQELEVF